MNTYTRAGWIDAGVAAGALQKYLTFDIPQKLVIGPTGHEGDQFVDLFGEHSGGSSREPEWTESHMLDYFAEHLKSERDSTLERKIVYYTYGTETWRETATWPPEGVREQTYYLAVNNELRRQEPDQEVGVDEYTVDFTTSTGTQNRWMGQLGRIVQYGDRQQEDQKLLHYTTDPVTSDLEITGSPTISLYVASTESDGAFHVYLEDVGPDGQVTYLTEGLLRAIHRKTFDSATAPFIPLGAYHTFRENDVMPLVPGEIANIQITLNPISAVIRKGHALRVAIAGHDAASTDSTPGSTIWATARMSPANVPH